MAFKKYVYHCFIFVTNKAEDFFSFVFVYQPISIHGLKP